MFKVYKTEVEKQLNRKINVRSNHGAEFYGKNDETGQHKGLFFNCLQECGIVA